MCCGVETHGWRVKPCGWRLKRVDTWVGGSRLAKTHGGGANWDPDNLKNEKRNKKLVKHAYKWSYMCLG